MYLLMVLFIPVLYSWHLPSLPTKPKLYVNNRNFNETKFISITPGGIAGFYTMGICNFIKEHYNIDEYSFLGASAGAWNSVVFSYKGNSDKLIKDIVNKCISNSTDSINQLQYNLKDIILNEYTIDDFDINRIYISVSEFDHFHINANIIHNFTSLDTLLECCMVSSHIPYITSQEFIRTYNNKITFDGGFLPFPPKSCYNHITISPGMFNTYDVGNLILNFLKRNITTKHIFQLYHNGYNDARIHKKKLDQVFLPEYHYLNIKDNDFDIIYKNNL